MKNILPPFFLLLCLYTKAQTSKPDEKIYFFRTKDSLIGVRSETGKIILQPRAVYADYSSDDLRKPIQGNLIYLFASIKEPQELHSWGSVYNRKGQFLYAPFMFDNGPDGVCEGLSRFVKNKKMGFVNRNGDIVIEAKYDYAQMFNYGTAVYCNGCVWHYQNEHSFVTGGTWGYINYKGDTVGVYDKKLQEKDQKVDSNKFLHYQFSYSPFEQKIIDSFYKLPVISRAYFVGHYGDFDSNELKLHYEIVERPSSFFPYYYIAAFENSGGAYRGDPFGGLNFFVDKKGSQFYYSDAEEKIPLKIWLKKYIKQAKEFSKKHPDTPNKFFM